MRLLSTVLVVLTTFVCGCTRAATQLVVSVDSDIEPTRLVEVRVSARPLDPSSDAPTDEHVFETASLPLPFSLGVRPPLDRRSPRLEIVVEGRDAEHHAFVRRTVRTSFVAEQTLLLTVFLSTRCIDSTCEATDGLTCVEGTCVPAELDPSTLPRIAAGDERRDAGARDAPGLDAPGLDAGSMNDAGPIAPFTDPSSVTVVSGSEHAWDVATDDTGTAYVGLSQRHADGSAGWTSNWSGLLEVRVVRRIRDALYVCMEGESTLRSPEGTSFPLPAAHGSGSAIVLARLDLGDGHTVWASQLTRGAPSSGADLRMDCGGIAEIPGGLALAFGADGSASDISFDGVPIATRVGATASATGFVLRLADDGARARPLSIRQLTTAGRLYTEFTPFWPRYQLDVVEDGGDGTLVTAFGVGPLVGLGDGESMSGSTPTVAIARYDASGTPSWTRRFTMPGMQGSHTPRAAVIDDTVYLAFDVNVASGGSTTLAGVTGLAMADSVFDQASLVIVPLALADGTPDAGRFRRTAHGGAITAMLAEPSGELILVGYATGDESTAMLTDVDTFGATWTVPDRDAGFVAVLEVSTLDARWMHPIAGEAVMEDGFGFVTEWERVTGLDVSPTGVTWITGKLRTGVATNEVLGHTVPTVGYSARLR